MLAACAGGGSGNTARTPTTAQPVATPSFDRNQAAPLGGGATAAARASNEPVLRNDAQNFAFVGGVDPNPLLAHITRGCTTRSCDPSSLSARHGGAEIGHIRLRDGVSASELLRYLRADANHFSEGVVQRWGNTPPVVRLVEGSSSSDMQHTELAVRLINSALPANWQIRLDGTPAARTADQERGVITVAFLPKDQWPDGGCSARAIGCAGWFNENGRVVSGGLVVDPNRTRAGRHRVFVLLHEILHTLGRGHVDPATFPDTVMHPAGDEGQGQWLVLDRLDEAALYAIYSRLSAGTPAGDLDHTSLGPWNDVSTHVYGQLGYIPGRFDAVIFGAVWQNGNVRPYAMALDPSPPLAGGSRSGSATWSGRLAGLTPQAEAVAGAADMTVQLGTLRGALDFTGLEKWAAHAAPGAIGTGAQWGDGDLNYRIAVNGQVFYETGGDTGKVTGVFYGASHRKVGGTLRRHDLAAGFGAQRQ